MQREESDEAVAAAAAAGSREAFGTLVSRLGGVLLVALERQAGDPERAADLAQEVWLKCWRALPRWRPAGTFRSWLFSIAFNHLRDARRAERRSRVVYLDEFRDAPAAPARHDPRGRVEEHAAIEGALDGVPEPFRTALVAVDVCGLSYDEAAAALECAVGTVKSRVNRARHAFREAYSGAARDARGAQDRPAS